MELGNTLVIRPGALGDAILTLPALHALRLAGARNLTVLGSLPSWAFHRRAHGGLRVGDFSSSAWLGLFEETAPLGQAAEATLARVNTAVVYVNGRVDTLQSVLKRYGIKRIVCGAPPTLNPSSGSGVPQESSGHAAERLLRPISALLNQRQLDKALGLLELSTDPFLRLEQQELVQALAHLGWDAVPPGGLFALHPGSGGKNKCWPAERFAKLAVHLACVKGITPVALFGPADDTMRQDFEASMPAGVTWECVHNRPLREVLALLSMCTGFLGNDSGLSHLAARACPTWVLFGPTDPKVWVPIGKRVSYLRAPSGSLQRLSVTAVLKWLF